MRINPYELQFDANYYVNNKQLVCNLGDLVDVVGEIAKENSVLKQFIKDNVARINFSAELQAIIDET